MLRNIVSFRSFDIYWISFHILLTTVICNMWKSNLMQWKIFHHVTCSCKFSLYNNTSRPNIMLCGSWSTTTLHCTYYVMLHYFMLFYITVLWYMKFPIIFYSFFYCMTVIVHSMLYCFMWSVFRVICIHTCNHTYERPRLFSLLVLRVPVDMVIPVLPALLGERDRARS